MSLILNIIFHFLLICLSLHACTSARPLHEGTAGPSLQLISNIKVSFVSSITPSLTSVLFRSTYFNTLFLQ